jgi:hypothetical protein
MNTPHLTWNICSSSNFDHKHLSKSKQVLSLSRVPISTTNIFRSPSKWSHFRNIMPSSALEAQLHYLAPLPIYDHVKPYGLLVPPPPSQPRTNIQTCPYNGIVITDLRRCETEMSLDTAGFEFIKHRSSCDFDLKESIEEQYLQESSDLLKAKLGAESIYVFDYTVRANEDV